MRRFSFLHGSGRGGALAAGIGLALALAGCAGQQPDVTGSIQAARPTTDAELRRAAAEWGRRNEADPADKTAALNYAQALRGLTQYAQATAVLSAVAVKHPYDKEILSAYGKALADTGRLREAADVLSRAHTPERPDWTVLSAQGSVADQLGDHAGAVAYYEAALKIRPGEPSVLSNLGLSYALARDLPTAEQMLRSAADNPRAGMRVRQNYALVLALEGKFEAADAVARRDLSPADAAASIASIRAMIAQSDTWHKIQSLDRHAPAKPADPPPNG